MSNPIETTSSSVSSHEIEVDKNAFNFSFDFRLENTESLEAKSQDDEQQQPKKPTRFSLSFLLNNLFQTNLN